MSRLNWEKAAERDRMHDHGTEPLNPARPGTWFSPGAAVKKCPACGSGMRLRHGKYGDFYGCSRFPACTQTLKVNTAAAQ